MGLLKIFILGLLTVTLVGVAHGENILFVLTCASYSHRVAQWPLAEALMKKGHNVTFISPAVGPIHNENITDIVPGKMKTYMEEAIKSSFDVNHRVYGLVPPINLVLDFHCFQACKAMLESEEIKEWLKTEPKVDLVISDMFAECSYGLVEKFQAKNILYNSLPTLTRHLEAFSQPYETSIPDMDLPSVPVSFFQRLWINLLMLLSRVLEIYYYNYNFRPLFETELGLSDMPSVYDVRENTSLILLSGDYLQDYPRSVPPFFVKIPGMHVKKPGTHSRLAKEVEDFVDDKKNNTQGFMYISFGTVAKSTSIPIQLRQIFLNVIRTFSNLKFIWIWDGQLPQDAPENLMFSKWVDQQDVLAHKKIKGFITQAGRPSTLEALANGVPMITFPVLADQDFNAHRFENLGFSINLDFIGLTEGKLKDAIEKIINDDSYKKRAAQLSRLSADVIMDPVETGLWWVEFVLRHTPEELQLMKPLSRHLTWYEKRDLDVWTFLFLCSGGLLYLFYRIVSVCVGSRKTDNDRRVAKETKFKSS